MNRNSAYKEKRYTTLHNFKDTEGETNTESAHDTKKYKVTN